MKKNAFSSIMLSSLFYTTLLSTTFVVPLVLARDNAIAPAVENPQAWDRTPNAPTPLQQQRNQRLPQTDAPASGIGAKPAPIDKSGPDSGMIKPGKVRVKTLKV